MVNTRRTGSGSDQQEQNNQSTGQPLPMPPPLTPEQFFQLQMQMMATLNNTVQSLQQIHAQPPPPPPPQPRDRRADFLRGHPPTFSHATDPLQADDWLHSQGSCEAPLLTGGSPTQLGIVRLSRGTSSVSVSGTITFLRAS
ncbi:hypothetical protein PAHAL_7G057200 [Panicum hallii]|uniref:Uncharacterized protein n=1 Tax=Panicum hallii TaxID=206008 RepID=A0A2T8IB35_9POAL|nr:hypothetical protein PAHAL_7G057200 [Panicum hallii]